MYKSSNIYQSESLLTCSYLFQALEEYCIRELMFHFNIDTAKARFFGRIVFRAKMIDIKIPDNIQHIEKNKITIKILINFDVACPRFMCFAVADYLSQFKLACPGHSVGVMHHPNSSH